MRTRDFSAAPPVAQAEFMLTVQPAIGSASMGWLRRAASALKGEGLLRQEWLRLGVRRSGVIGWYADHAAGMAALQRVQGAVDCTAQVHHANPDGYSNGVWRAESEEMAHIERFSPVGSEQIGPRVARKRAEGPELRVESVRTRADLKDFMELPVWDRRSQTHGVPLWHSTIRRWWTGRGPHREHGPVELYLVRDEQGDVRGRTTLHTDERLDARLGERMLLLGATEFADEAALAAMVEYAAQRARILRRTRLLGPVSLLPNQVGGVVTSGWDEPGFLDGPWNPEHYPSAWEGLGFERIWSGSTWRCPEVSRLDPKAVFPLEALPEGVVLRHADRRQLTEQLPLLRQMLNASFAELGYFTRIEADELAVATDGLAHLLDERLLLWLEQDGDPVAFVLVVPDLTEFVRSTGGRLAPVDMVRLLLTKQRHRRDAVLIIKGTVPGARGQGLMRHLSHQLLVGLRAGGYDNLRVTFVEDDNTGSQSQFVAMGGSPLHGTCFYTRAVEQSQAGDTPNALGAAGAAGAADTPASRLLARAADWGRAPSAHNTQPWDIVALDEVTLRMGWHAERELPVADATRRDLMLSLGAVALSLQVVAAELGLLAQVEWGVDGGTRQAALIRLSAASAHQTTAIAERQPWSVTELHDRATVRAPYVAQPPPDETTALARVAGLADGTGLLVLPDSLVDDLLPGATAHALTGPAAKELASWLRLAPAHPRHDLDGLSAQALGLSRVEARGLALLTGSAVMRRVLGTTRLDHLVARASGARPRGAVLALWGRPGLELEELGALGGSLLATWLAGERSGWSAHPLSELLDEPTAASTLHAHVSDALGHPAQAYAVWRCGRANVTTGRSPRLTD